MFLSVLPGYQGNGASCTWIGLCQYNNGGCHPLAACTESSGISGRACTCPPGYVGNGIGSSGCVSQGAQSGPCSSTPCLNGAACQVWLLPVVYNICFFCSATIQRITNKWCSFKNVTNITHVCLQFREAHV